MIEIDFNGNPFEDSKNIKDDFSALPSEIDKVNNLAVATYYDVKFNSINPYKKGDSVILDTSKHDRYSYIRNIKENTVGRISGVFGHSIVNVSYESTMPATVKTVPVSHLRLVEATFMQKVRFFILSISFVRKFLIKRINKNRGRK